MMGKTTVIMGCISGALAVAAGAFGAHALSDFLAFTGRSETYETAVRYHLYHSLLLILIGILGRWVPIKAPSYLIVTGIILFSGSLYLLVLTEIRAFAFVTPFGGIALISGWLVLAYNVRKSVL